MKCNFRSVVFSAIVIPSAVLANEIKIQTADSDTLRMVVYSQNTALVQMEKKINLPQGISDLSFEGVAEQMQPQTSLLSVGDARVVEKNYEYNVLNQENLLNAYIGKQVKTVRINPADGKNIYENAILLNNSFGAPLLKFSYGIEANFPGRVVFNDIPENLRVKPTLAAKVNNPADGEKNIELTYLTNGVSWSTNYVADLTQTATLNLQAWAEINNQSGADYNNAQISLLAGNVKTENQIYRQPRVMMAMAKGVAANSLDEADGVVGTEAEAVNGYYIYPLPEKVSLLDKQTKQISLWYKPDVRFDKLYKIASYLNMYGNKKFEKTHASITYKLTNTEENKLGIPLPQGKIRFYEQDSQGNTRFLGTSTLKALAVGEDSEVNIGESYDLYADGAVTAVTKISEKTSELDYKIDFFNASENEEGIVFTQNIAETASLISESQKSDRPQASELKWIVKVPAKGKATLTYKIRTTKD